MKNFIFLLLSGFLCMNFSLGANSIHDKRFFDINGHDAHQDHDHFFVEADYLLMKFSNNNLDYAVESEDGSTPSGKIKSLKFDYESGFRAKFGFGFNSGWDVNFGYTNLCANQADHLTPESGTLIPITNSDSALNAPQPIPAIIASFGWETPFPILDIILLEPKPQANIDLQIFDLEVGYWHFSRNKIKIKSTFGLRIADIDQSSIFNSSLIDVLDTTDLNASFGGDIFTNPFYFSFQFSSSKSLNSTAYGIRTGVNLHWKLHENFSLFSNSNLSLLAGDFNSKIKETLSHEDLGLGTRSFTLINVNANYWKLVPVLETSVGINWQSYHWMAQVGVELQSWFNMSEKISFHGKNNLSNHSNNLSTLSLDGLFARVAFSW